MIEDAHDHEQTGFVECVYEQERHHGRRRQGAGHAQKRNERSERRYRRVSEYALEIRLTQHENGAHQHGHSPHKRKTRLPVRMGPKYRPHTRK